MPLSYEFEQGGRFLHVRASGVLSLQEMQTTRAQLMHDERARGVSRAMIDLRAVERFAIDGASLRSLASEHITLPFVSAGSRMAFVVGSPIAYGLARMYELSRLNAPDKVEVFKTDAEARGWLGEW